MPTYGGLGGGAAPFSPNANQFTPFANQFGGLGLPWSMPPGMGQQYQVPDATAGNYSVGPAASNAGAGLNQQATAFTPRTANIGQGKRANHRQNQQTSGNGHPATQEQNYDAVEEQMRRLNMNQRPQ